MLLDFERDVSQMFDPEADVLTEKGIDLGINSRDIEYKNDAGNRYFGFALNGTLWLFDSSASRVTQVFSFPQESGSDVRDTYGQNDIQIINIDENGNMYFLIWRLHEPGSPRRRVRRGHCIILTLRYPAWKNVCLWIPNRITSC